MKTTSIGYVLTALAVLPMTVNGQCRTVRTVQTVGGQPVVVQSVQCGTPLVQTPTVQYQAQTYATDYQHKTVVLPVQVQPDFVFSVNDALRDKLLVDAIAGRLAPVLAQQQQALNQTQQANIVIMQQLQQLITGRPVPDPYAPAPAPVPPLQMTQPQRPAAIPPVSETAATTGGADAGQPVRYQAKPELTALFAAKCNFCHGDAGKIKGGLDLRDLSKLTDKQWSDVYITCDLGTMPKDGKPLDDAEYKLVREAVREARSQARK